MSKQEQLHLIAGRSYRVNHTFYGDVIIAVIGYADHFNVKYSNQIPCVLKVKLKKPTVYFGTKLVEGTELFMNKGFIKSFHLCH